MAHSLGCNRFWLWSLAGGLTTFALLAAASIGLFVLPFAVLALWFALRQGSVWPEALGVLVGAAAVCFLIAWVQRDPGGVAATPWLLAGATLTAAGIGGYALLGRRAGPPVQEPSVE